MWKLLKCCLVCSIQMINHLIYFVPHLAVWGSGNTYVIVAIHLRIYQVVNNYTFKLSMMLDHQNIHAWVCNPKFGDFLVIIFFLRSTQRPITSLVCTNKGNYHRIGFFSFAFTGILDIPQLDMFLELTFIIILCTNLKIILTIGWFAYPNRSISRVKLFYPISQCSTRRILLPIICLIYCTLVQTCHNLCLRVCSIKIYRIPFYFFSNIFLLMRIVFYLFSSVFLFYHNFFI